MDSEAKQVKQLLVLSFWFFFAAGAAIRMLALFRCAWQQSAAGLPVDPLGNSLGVLTPLFGFPLNLLQVKAEQTNSGLSALLNCGIILNGLFLGFVFASFMIGGMVLLTKRNLRCVQPHQ